MAAPTRADRFRPAELVGLASVLAVFTGVIVIATTREWILAVISLGVVFIVALVVLAMLSLAAGPVGTEVDLRGDSPTAPRADTDPATGQGEGDDDRHDSGPSGPSHSA